MNLETLWFGLIAVLWTGYFFLEGFDFGVGTLLPFVGHDDTDRRVLVNAIGPVWDGNEVWLIVAGGATFAAFPGWYATLFSGFYLALFLVLAALIFRGVAFEFRGKDRSVRWKAWWDRAIFWGSAVPALLWGVAWANILRGVPIDARQEFVGSFFDLLNPYALLGGVMTLLLFTLHGAVFLTLRTEGSLRERTRAVAIRLSWPATAAVLGFLSWTYVNAVEIDNKGVVPGVVPIAAIGLVAAVSWLLHEKLDGWAFLATGLGVVLLTATIFLNLYPRVLVSSLGAANDLTIWNVASSHYTLKVMTIVALTFTPVVLLYQGWTYWVFRRRLGRIDVTGPQGDGEAETRVEEAGFPITP
ncbi:MAG TPA: cytochrome d ubiquinol oxidase subunit II [Actinomycetota bacterium]|nr:cytochrome d ubiquinol oxidase subunit II [Actinomycetota bacterium]